jgi:hypothetical protein
MAGVPLAVAILEADVRFHRERYALYRSRTHGSSPGSEVRFRQLERTYRLAESRLQQARETPV